MHGVVPALITCGVTPLHAALPDVRLPPDAGAKLNGYLDLLAKWNRTYNLTAIRARAQMMTHHVHDALAVLPFIRDAAQLRLLDVGTGAGIPGIPLAIARPAWHIVLVDPNHKRVAFLTQAIIELALANVRAIASRVEDLADEVPFDIVISRAFSDLPRFVRAASHHVAKDGELVAMKGVLPRDEIDALPAEVSVVATPSLRVPGVDAERHLVILRVRKGAA